MSVIGDIEEEKIIEEVAEPHDPSAYNTDEEGKTWGDRLLVPKDELSPKHRKFAELLAAGCSNAQIKEQMGFSDAWISTLRSNNLIRAECERIRERIYEDVIAKRLRAMAEPALNEIERCITDKHNRYKVETKVETAKWLIEKIDGKAVQKHDVGENILAIVMDKLDSLKAAGRTVSDIIDVQGRSVTAISHDGEAPKARTEEDYLADWVVSFDPDAKK